MPAKNRPRPGVSIDLKRNKTCLRHPIVVFSLSLMLAVGVSGCLVNRMATVKNQFCEFDSNFTLSIDESMDFNLHQPVLLDSDLIWLAGAKPTSTKSDQKQMRMTYTIEKIEADPNPDEDIEINLHFERIHKDYKLSQIQFDKHLTSLYRSALIDNDSLEAAYQNVCDVGWGLASLRMGMDIKEKDLEMLPSRNEMFNAFGQPTTVIEKDRVFLYKYRLKNSEKTASVLVWFDETGNRPLRMEAHYLRYQAKADFVSRKMTVKVEI